MVIHFARIVKSGCTQTPMLLEEQILYPISPLSLVSQKIVFTFKYHFFVPTFFEIPSYFPIINQIILVCLSVFFCDTELALLKHIAAIRETVSSAGNSYKSIKTANKGSFMRDRKFVISARWLSLTLTYRRTDNMQEDICKFNFNVDNKHSYRDKSIPYFLV